MAQLQDGRIMEKEIFPHIIVITTFSGDVEEIVQKVLRTLQVC